MPITLDKKYNTANGYSATVLTTTATGTDGKPYTVALAHLPPECGATYGSDRLLTTDSEGQSEAQGWSLVEVNPWEDLKAGEPVMVRNHDNAPWTRAYFAEADDSSVRTYWGGATAWSAKGRGSTNDMPRFWHWSQCRPPTDEELRS